MDYDFLTIVKPVGVDRASKKFIRMPSGNIITKPYPKSYIYDFSTVDVSDIEGLAMRLAEIAHDGDAMVLRGRPLVERGRRLYKPDSKSGDSPTLAAVDHYWIGLDIDGINVDPAKGAIGTAISALPACFRGVSCYYQMSSSYGVKGFGQVRCHLWFWCDRPVCGFSLREWLKDSVVDVSFFNPVQPHYVAAPEFSGMDDPVEERIGFVRGRPCVILPDVVQCLDDYRQRKEIARIKAEKELARKVRRLKIHDPSGRKDHRKMQVYAMGALRAACETIQSQTQGDRHRTIYSEAASIAEMAAYLDAATAKAALVDAGNAALAGEGRDVEVRRTVEDGWNEGIKTPRDLRTILIK
jgi:hypothetical protein